MFFIALTSGPQTCILIQYPHTAKPMKNALEYYKGITSAGYHSFSLMGAVTSASAKKTIYPMLEKYKGLKILELGCGTGAYTSLYCARNAVTCVDLNPHLFQLKNVPLICGDCRRLDSLLPRQEKYDRILAFFMTEYLAPDEITRLLQTCAARLNPGGEIVLTFITGFWGTLYVWGSRIFKATGKHTFSLTQVKTAARSAGLSIGEIRHIGRFGLDSALLVTFSANP